MDRRFFLWVLSFNADNMTWTHFWFFYRCPYYVSRELHKAVDILFAPYNYLIDRGYRKSLNIEWTNSILIFDEAHNLVTCTFNRCISIFLECSPLHYSCVVF